MYKNTLTKEFSRKSQSHLLYGVVVAVGRAAVGVEGGLLERLVLEVALAVVLQDLRVVGDESRNGVPHHEQKKHLHVMFELELCFLPSQSEPNRNAMKFKR